MSLLKLEFDVENKVLALAFGKALTEIAQGGVAVCKSDVVTITKASQPGPSTSLEQEDVAASVQAFVSEAEQAGKSVDTATGQEFSTTSPNSADAGANNEKATYDTKGVPFIPAICAVAAKPFYASGPYKGQWKKGTKVDQAEYDRIYGEALAKVVATQQKPIETTLSPAEEAFGAPEEVNTGNSVDDTMSENPIVAQDVFALYGELCALPGGAEAANATCLAEGIANGSLIFSRPDLVGVLYPLLRNLKNQLGAGA